MTTLFSERKTYREGANLSLKLHGLTLMVSMDYKQKKGQIYVCVTTLRDFTLIICAPQKGKQINLFFLFTLISQDETHSSQKIHARRAR